MAGNQDARVGRDFEVYDIGGRHLGRVVEAGGLLRLGPGAATVFLDRSASAGPERLAETNPPPPG
jgi:hypothetical protein